jgi:invasion protein IalB
MSKIFFRLAAVSVLMAGGAALAEPVPKVGLETPPQGPISADLVPVEPEWTKVCAKDAQSRKDICYTARDFGTKADSPILSLQIFEEKGSDQKLLRFLLPLGTLLRPGFRFAVDKGAFESGNFEVCFPAGCFAETKIRSSVVDSMKKGEKAIVVIKNQANNEVTFYLPLDNFAKAYDGAPIDTAVFEERQRKLQEELQKKAEEQRGRSQGGKIPPASPQQDAPKK